MPYSETPVITGNEYASTLPIWIDVLTMSSLFRAVYLFIWMAFVFLKVNIFV